MILLLASTLVSLSRPVRLKPTWTSTVKNIIDETKETSGRIVDANIGESIDAANSKRGTSDRVDDILNQPNAAKGSLGAQKKTATLGEKGFKVGQEADLHDLAQSKQP
ncbi:hypothetical protein EDB82DRAFT_167508 [Fusarium venenatum]|uniref:uncharacterized protein n=1 Tax=Fusarium venenatum TaxID=56646 RepID=UPI001D49DFA3|nr:hypothetical protein EDB82DRAFT_167508 [Fusarium venenatum]